ncbi:MAG: trypsin-like peptidase domain-containing protein [Planctomycetes bacterium]|nr:trypsin-like peptidase domain-containing protein [Planctomycetota bacterium]
MPNRYDYKNLDDRPNRIGFWSALGLKIAALIMFFVFVLSVITACAAPPDPWIRMTSPSGCSGGVFHSSREHGVWIATCKHCVNRRGRVRLTFFQNGQRAKVDGEFVRSHPHYDCAIVWVSPDIFYELPTAVPLADGYAGPFKGQSVFVVGSWAGGTVTPAVRHVAISSVDRGAYQFRLNDYAWSGHSGGPVVDVATGGMLGVLWGTSGETSLITSNRALIETFLSVWDSGQAMYSIHDDINAVAHQAGIKPQVKVRANRRGLDRIRWDVESSHYLRDHFEWKWDHEFLRSTPRIEWKIDGRGIYSRDWHGVDGFIWQFRNSGGQYTCPDYRTPPRFGGGQSPKPPFAFPPFNPLQPTVPKQPDPPPPPREEPPAPRRPEDIRKIGNKISDAAEEVADKVETVIELMEDGQDDINEAVETFREVGKALESTGRETRDAVTDNVESITEAVRPVVDEHVESSPIEAPADEGSGTGYPPWLPWAVAAGAGVWGITRKKS